MNRLKSAVLTAAVASALFIAGAARAEVWIEAPPGAGETTATAQITGSTLGAALSEIRGTLNTVLMVDSTPRNEVDLYKIFIDDFSSFSARTVSSNPDDTALFLFDFNGRGVYTNDDNSLDLLSFLPAGGPLSNGFYYIGVSVGGFTALDAASKNVFLTGSFTDVLAGDGAAGALASWDQGFATLSEGGLAYDIALTGAVVGIPEPTTALLLLAGLGGLAARRMQGRRKSGAA